MKAMHMTDSSPIVKQSKINPILSKGTNSFHEVDRVYQDNKSLIDHGNDTQNFSMTSSILKKSNSPTKKRLKSKAQLL